MVGGRAPAADLAQGHRLQPVAGQLSRRPDIPCDLSGSCRGSRGLAPPRFRTGAGGWRRDRRRDRGGAPATAVGGRAGHVADRQVRDGRRAADHRRRGRCIPGYAAALAQALGIRRAGRLGADRRTGPSRRRPRRPGLLSSGRLRATSAVSSSTPCSETSAPGAGGVRTTSAARFTYSPPRASPPPPGWCATASR